MLQQLAVLASCRGTRLAIDSPNERCHPDPLEDPSPRIQ